MAANDVSITAANVVIDSSPTPLIDRSLNAGATLTAGDVVYKDSSDNNDLKLADCDNTESTADAWGIALAGASDGQPCPVLRKGTVTIGGTVAAGSHYVVSDTAGALTLDTDLTTDDYITDVGVAVSTTKLAVDFTKYLNSTGAQHA